MTMVREGDKAFSVTTLVLQQEKYMFVTYEHLDKVPLS